MMLKRIKYIIIFLLAVLIMLLAGFLLQNKDGVMIIKCPVWGNVEADKGMYYRIINLSPETVRYGAECSIEHYREGGWEEWKPINSYSVDLWLKTVQPMSWGDKEVAPLDAFGVKRPGKYRIVKIVRIGETSETIYCYFTIK